MLANLSSLVQQDLWTAIDESNLPSVTGKVWTTDAIYRETKAKLEARKNEGYKEEWIGKIEIIQQII